MKTVFLLLLVAVTAIRADIFQEGIDAYHDADYGVAIERFEEAAAENETGAVRHNMALSLYQAGKPSQAIWELERALRLEPNNEQFHFKLGALRQQLGLPNSRPAWHELASRAISQQSWIVLLAGSFWVLLATSLLPRFGGLQANLLTKALGAISLVSLLLSASALFLNRGHAASGVVTTDAPVELHAAPASAAPQIGLARPGERGQLVDQHNAYVEIETEGGARGWVSAERFRLIQ